MARGLGRGLRREALECDGQNVRAKLRVEEDSVFFDGHFEGFPIFPAVAQLQALVIDLATEAYPEIGEVIEARRLKFQRPILPGAELEIELTRTEARVSFKILTGGEPASAGVLEFAQK